MKLEMRYFGALLIFAWPAFLIAQKEQARLIQEPINNLFLAMEKGDSSMASKSFYNDALLVTVLEKDAKTSLRKEPVQTFLKAIGTPHTDIYHEELWDVKVDRDGNYAQAWANYAFYIGNKFSHCGVDTFQLIKTETGWKIFYLADTRRKEGCQIPDSITKKYSGK